MSDTPTYMLDTNVFNDLLRGQLSLSIFGQCRLVATGIQRDELSKTKDGVQRASLLERFDTIKPDIVTVESFAFDIEGAGWDQANWNDGSGNFERMLQRLQDLDRRKKRPKDPRNQMRDILIAETAIKINAVLISSDVNLCSVMREFGGGAKMPAKL